MSAEITQEELDQCMAVLRPMLTVLRRGPVQTRPIVVIGSGITREHLLEEFGPALSQYKIIRSDDYPEMMLTEITDMLAGN